MSLRIVNVHTEPSLLLSTLVAMYGTATKSALNVMSPANSAGTPRAVQVLVEVVAGGIVLVPAAAAVAEGLLLGELLAGLELGGFAACAGRGEAESAEGGHGADHLEEVAPADADGGQALGQEIELLVGNAHG